jgi:hypothetical protein
VATVAKWQFRIAATSLVVKNSFSSDMPRVYVAYVC